MILSRSNLQVVDITKKDDKVPALDNVHIREDGSTVAIGGRMMMAVSPVTKNIKKQILNLLPESDEDGRTFTVSAKSIQAVLSAVKPDREFKGLREHTNLKSVNKDRCIFEYTDGKRDSSISAKLYKREFLPHVELLQKVFTTCTGEKNGGNMRLVVNIKRLLLLLTAIEKAAPDSSGHNPVWIEFTNDGYIIIRAVNMLNGQRVVGVMSPLPGEEGKWLELGPWEKQFLIETPTNEKTTVHKTIVHKKVMKHKIK